MPVRHRTRGRVKPGRKMPKLILISGRGGPMKRLVMILLILTSPALAESPRPAIVLVHGAFADASGWSRVIPILQRDGYFVTAVQIPLTSLSDDTGTAKRVVDSVKGPVVLVGHSYGGAVITGAAAGSPNVKALVYLAAFAPEAGETLGAPGKNFAQPPLNSALVPDSAGFLYIDRAKFHDAFCKDLPDAEARVMAATQKPLHSSVFEASVAAAAWKSIPSWFVVSQQDR